MLDSHKCGSLYWEALFFKVEYCKSFLVCFSSGSFYIFEPIESALAQVSATGKCELATSGQSPSGALVFLFQNFPFPLEVLCSAKGDCATCLQFGFVVYIYLVLIC